jgi:hypothetical protein
MNTYARSIELDAIAAEVLAEMGLEYETDYIKLRPAVDELRSRTGIQVSSARTVIARHLRKTRGLVVRSDGKFYRVVSITDLPHPPDAEPVPLVLVAERQP